VSFHRRRLPHWHPERRPLFLTWHLRGSLPLDRYPALGSEFAGRAFEWIDRSLDGGKSGPVWLALEDVAQVAVDALDYGARAMSLYDLHAFVVMPNHVHTLLTPHAGVPRLVQAIKGFSAREANRILGRAGEPFWEREYLDHWIRNDAEFARVCAYIENNPVRAGLVSRAGEFRWSSACDGWKAVAAG
jgi:REP element-mobilizing transposase RayT